MRPQTLYSIRLISLVSFCIALAKTTAPVNAKAGATNDDTLMRTNNSVIVRKQAAIWIPIMMAIISVIAVYALFAIDDVKNRDTILYSKFLANLKDR